MEFRRLVGGRLRIVSAIVAPNLGQAEGTVLLVAGGLALVAVLYVLKKGVGPAAAQAGAAVVDAAGSAVSGGVGAVSTAAGIPTPDQTTTDAGVARWLIDNYGYWDASQWAGAPALFRAMTMSAGSGTAPAAGTAVANAHPATPAMLANSAIDYGTATADPGGW